MAQSTPRSTSYASAFPPGWQEGHRSLTALPCPAGSLKDLLPPPGPRPPPTGPHGFLGACKRPAPAVGPAAGRR